MCARLLFMVTPPANEVGHGSPLLFCSRFTLLLFGVLRADDMDFPQPNPEAWEICWVVVFADLKISVGVQLYYYWNNTSGHVLYLICY